MDSYFGSQYGDQSFQQGSQQHDDRNDDMSFGDIGSGQGMFAGAQNQQNVPGSRRQSHAMRDSISHNDNMDDQNNQFAGMVPGGGSFDDYNFNPNALSQNVMMMNMMGSAQNQMGSSKGGIPQHVLHQYMNSSPSHYGSLDSPASNMSQPQNPNQMMPMSMMHMPQNFNNGQNNHSMAAVNNSQADNFKQNGMNFMGSAQSTGLVPQNAMMNQMMMGNIPPNFQHNASSNSAISSVSPAGPGSAYNDVGQQMNSMGDSGFLDSRTSSANTTIRQPAQNSQSRQNSAVGSLNVQNNGLNMGAHTMLSPTRGYQGPWNTGQPGHPSSMALRPNQEHSYVNAYSSTGFDMMQVLMRVATRKNPEINIGAVDLSCAFVVCNALEHDFPIVYCSENFERLTGYTKHEILGRNCRFLQAPDGKVQAGVQRHYVDDNTVLYLKNAITARREAQVSLINYRKGGQPFMNLLTMIPVGLDSEEVRFFVGFQVDLVEQPNSMTGKNPDGTYVVNYQRGLTMPRYIYSQPELRATESDSGQTVSRDEVSHVLATMGAGESDLTKRVWDKVLLENTDDVIYVLSLKGLFLYLSPSSKKTLEYEPNELVGTALSSICHPSDIVPVTRELKDTPPGAAISVVYRIRRKHSGYMWFEAHGTLHTEQGKGRKSIVLVGRERPVYAVSKADLSSSGGIAENEVWTKISTSGMFLYVSLNIRSMLDKQPEELVGTSIQILMRAESRVDFSKVLEVARTGRRASAKHELVNRRGQVLQAFSTVYPGDAAEGTKPTFFVVQTRLLKFSRPTAGNKTPTAKLERESMGRSFGESISSPMGSMGMQSSRRNSNAMSLPSPSKYMSTFEAITTYAGQDGLPLGHQDVALASEQNLFDELKTTRSTSWQFELRQMEKHNRLLAEELQSLLAARKKRKRRKPAGSFEKECANCHTRQTPEWRRGPSGNRDLCNSCGLRWAKQQGRISPRTSSAKSAVSGGGSGSPQGQLGQHVSRRTPGNKESSGGETTRGIDETMASGDPPSASLGMTSTSNASKERSVSGDSHVSKAQKTESGSPPSIPTKIEEE